MAFPYGLWASPISPSSQPTLAFQEVRCDQESIYWTESRLNDKGRCALMRWEKGEVFEPFPHAHVKTRVHEYGGGAFIAQDGFLVFYDEMARTVSIKTPENNIETWLHDRSLRLADFHIIPKERKLFCVCEEHTNTQVVNTLVQYDFGSQNLSTVHRGADFYASPQVNPQGSLFGFITWDFPSMPWQESKLMIFRRFPDGSLELLDSLGSTQESISYFSWISEEELIFSSDRSGFTNLYLWKAGTVSCLYQMNADFTPPLWTLGKTYFKLLPHKKKLLCTYCEKGIDHLAILNLQNKDLEKIPIPITAIKTLDVYNNHAVCIGGSPLQPLSIIDIDLNTFAWKTLASSAMVDPLWIPYISTPESISAISSVDGEEIYGFYYPPLNPHYSIDPHIPAPLIVRCHGGPTGHASPLCSLDVQFWTSRGFGWLDVNYRGSSGHGKHYRNELNGKWGVIDPRDCHDLAKQLIHMGKASKEHLFIRGSSAGGYTALRSTVLFRDYLGCTSLYGVTDLSLLSQETHKFEAHYLDTLVGPYPQYRQEYENRSPLYTTEKIHSAILFLHGGKDPVVPLSQAEKMHQALQEKRLPSKLWVFPEESHGFRSTENIQKALKLEYQFYLELLGLQLVEEL